MKKRNNKISRYFLLLAAAYILTACSSGNSPSTQAPSDNGINTEGSGKNSPAAAVKPGSDADSSKKLTIKHNCIGCGKCAMVDREHFSMEQGARIATVASSKNLDSSAIAAAIRICPVGAIELGAL